MSAPPNESGGADRTGRRGDRTRAEEAAEVDSLAYTCTRHRYHAYAGGFAGGDADGRLGKDNAGHGLGRGVAGQHRIMSRPTEQTAVMASSFSSVSVPSVTACETPNPTLSGSGVLDGANDPDRTDDLIITNDLLYQLSYVG